MRPRLDIALAALVAVLLVVVLVVVSTGGSESRPTLSLATSSATAGFDGAALPEGIPAPLFTLTDQYGRRVSLASTRGHVAVLAFLYSTCGDTCVVIAQQIRGALEELPHPVPVLIVSADPAADTPAHVRSFLAEVSLSGRIQYLTGTPAQLKRIWRAYKVKPAGAGRSEFDRYASVLLLDAQGRERDLFEQEQLTPESLAHDIGKLAGEPTHP
jgi:protein SCO1/2